MVEDAHTQIILGTPFLAIVSYNINVNKGRLTFDVEQRHTKFGLFKESSLSSFSCCGCDVLDFDKLVELSDVSANHLKTLHVSTLRDKDLIV